MLLTELDEARTFLPQATLRLPAAPPSPEATFRGVAVYWLRLALPTSGPEARLAPGVPLWGWARMDIPFTALTLDHQDRPPPTTTQRDLYVRQAVAIVAARQGIPAYANILWALGLA